MTRRAAAFFLFYILTISFANAQTATISGKITDSKKQPLPGATIAIFGKPQGTSTDESGHYNLDVPANQPLKIVISLYGQKSDTININLKPNEKRDISISLEPKEYEMRGVTIEDQSLKSQNITRINPKIVKNLPGPDKSVEKLITLLPGVSSTNELSSTYSVRGGNYDENLVYINDFEVYRPLLVRSGQQEGLSVINPDMVSGISFSAGGFDAKYGDKLSSVLDIQYNRPKKMSGAVSLSLLGASAEFENTADSGRFYYMVGIRQKSTQYLLNTFDTKGDYKPSFTDVQVLTGYDFSKKFTLEGFADYAFNKYELIPQNRETNFGTINDAKRFTVYFEGQELDRYETFTGALSGTIHASESVNLKFIASAYRTDEQENFDILGQYYLDQLEADLGKASFGNVAFNLGIGSFLNHGRNNLTGNVYSFEHKGEKIDNHSLTLWGVKVQHEEFDDKLHEWYYNDSSGFSIPSYRDPLNPQIILNDVVITKNSTSAERYSGYLQHTIQFDSNRVAVTVGIRANYSTLNQETDISPRASISYKPKSNPRLNFRAAFGFYYQPPFYRELRDLDGTLYPNTKSQKSIHYVVGNDFRFIAMGRDFKLTTEVFYKDLETLVPYKVNDIRIRYLPTQQSKGYATGIDFRLFGEFVPGAESWASVSFLQTQEDIQGDFYYRKFNAEGEEIISGYTFNQVATDSVLVEPGYIPRPADQRFTFGIFFQDFLPKAPTYKMQLSLMFGSSLPFGPPGADRYKDVLRQPTYRRVDIGFSKQLIGDDVKKKPKKKFFKAMESAWVGLEVYNLLDVSNVASYLWVTDVSNARKYAVPNYLTGRQLNVRLNVEW